MDVRINTTCTRYTEVQRKFKDTPKRRMIIIVKINMTALSLEKCWRG